MPNSEVTVRPTDGVAQCFDSKLALDGNPSLLGASTATGVNCTLVSIHRRYHQLCAPALSNPSFQEWERHAVLVIRNCYSRTDALARGSLVELLANRPVDRRAVAPWLATLSEDR